MQLTIRLLDRINITVGMATNIGRFGFNYLDHQLRPVRIVES